MGNVHSIDKYCKIFLMVNMPGQVIHHVAVCIRHRESMAVLAYAPKKGRLNNQAGHIINPTPKLTFWIPDT